VSCFGNGEFSRNDFIAQLFALLVEKKSSGRASSYTERLFSEGRNRIAQKVGEEAVETVIAGLGADDEELISESADLLFHLMVLFADRGIEFGRVIERLERRHDDRIAES
jgi:phosphoribosyl-ATP pyrophosphohydrolase